MDPLSEALTRDDLTADAKGKLRGVERVLRDDPQARLLSLFFLGAEPPAVVSFGDVDRADLVAVVLRRSTSPAARRRSRAARRSAQRPPCGP